MSSPGFDRYAAEYEKVCNSALTITGEEKEFYARGRITLFAERLRQQHCTGSRLFDFGCGVGSSTSLFFELVGLKHMLGVDASGESVSRARAEFGSINADFEELERYEVREQFDLAYCNGVFHHIPPDERIPALKTIFDSLVPGGFFGLWENNPLSLGARYVMSRCAFDEEAIMLTPWECRRLLRISGFEVLTTDYLFIFPAVLKQLRPLERLLIKLPIGAQYMVLARKVCSNAF